MSRKFLTPIDLNKNELQNAVVQNLSGAPSSPVAGQVYYDSTANVLYYYNGSGWINAGGMTSGLLSSRPAAGSGNVNTFFYATDTKLIYFSNGSTWTQTQNFGAVANLGAVAADGSSNDYARADHVHRHAGADHNNISLNDLSHTANLTSDFNITSTTHTITLAKTPTNPSDAVNKSYVDNFAQGITWKAAVNLFATSNVPLTGATGTLIIDSHPALTVADTGYRILLTGQSTDSQNGIYVYTDDNSNYVLTRSADADVYTELDGATVYVQEGTLYGATSWVQSNHYLTSFAGQDWTQIAGAGAYVAGAGMVADGTTFNVVSATSSNIVVNADSIDLATVSRTNNSGEVSSTTLHSITTDSYGRVTAVNYGTHTLAGTTTAGIASFNSGNFILSSGAVTARGISITGTNVAVSTSSFTLGDSLSVSIPQSVATSATVQFGALGIGTTAPAAGVSIQNGALNIGASTADYTSIHLATSSTLPAVLNPGNIWYQGGRLVVVNTASAAKSVAYTDDQINASNISGTVAIANGGTGATTAAGALSALASSGASIAQKKTGNLNFSATTTVSIAHGLGTWVTAQVFDNSGYLIDMDVQNTVASSGTTIFTVSATSASATNYTYVIVG